MTEDETAAALALALAKLNAQLKPMVEATVGMRSMVIAEGFSEQTADEMALEYYRVLMAIMIKQVRGG